MKENIIAIKTFLKNNWILVLFNEVLMLITSFCGYSIIPFLRAINKGWGIFFAILFTLTAIVSLFSVCYLFYFKKGEITDKRGLIKFFYFFSTFFINGLIMTIFLAVFGCFNPQSQYLVEGFYGILLLLIYYFLFGFELYFESIFNFFKYRKRK